MMTVCMKKALEHMADELEGIEEYEHSAAVVVDPELKQILTANMVAEKEHARKLLGWITAHAAKALA
jgi:hypothetical protein